MATVLKTFRKVLGSGSAEQLTSSRILTQGFAVRAESGNAGTVYMGDASVTSTSGMFLDAGESNEKYARAMARGVNTVYDLSKLYIIGTSGDAVRVEYEAEE
jgi:hypothetical protein